MGIADSQTIEDDYGPPREEVDVIRRMELLEQQVQANTKARISAESEPKKRGRPKKIVSGEPAEKKPKSRATITKEITAVEKDLKKLVNRWNKSKAFIKDQKSAMTESSKWLLEQTIKEDHFEHKDTIELAVNYAEMIYKLQDDFEKMPSQTLSELKNVFLALANAMDTTELVALKNEHAVLKQKRQELKDLLGDEDEFDLK